MWSLCVFYHRLLDLRRPEVKALAHLFSLEGDSHPSPLEWGLPLHHHLDFPFHLVSLASELIACNIANRSMLYKGIYELCGEGSSCDELEEAISDFQNEQKLPFLSSESSFMDSEPCLYTV